MITLGLALAESFGNGEFYALYVGTFIIDLWITVFWMIRDRD